MLTLIRNAQVFSPDPLGFREVLIASGRVAAIAESIDISGKELEVVDAEGMWLLPGLVDPLTHPCGGGGEGGFGNRTAEILPEAFIRAGVTTPVGALGTDSITRNLDVLYGHVMTLRAHGISAHMFSGSYRLPAPTLTGDIARDLVLIEPVIGVGEVAIADHRSSHLSISELRRLASDVQLGGVLSGKGGTVLMHIGDSKSGLELIEKVLRDSDLPRRLFYPTHVNRQKALLRQAIDYTSKGGYADITVSTTPELLNAGEVPALEAFHQAIDAGSPVSHLTFSSDAGGSLPHYEHGVLVGLKAAEPDSLLRLLQSSLADDRNAHHQVIQAMTRNPARALHLHGKGRIQAGADADLLLLEPDKLKLIHVMGQGRWLMRDGEIQQMKDTEYTGAYS